MGRGRRENGRRRDGKRKKIADPFLPCLALVAEPAMGAQIGNWRDKKK